MQSSYDPSNYDYDSFLDPQASHPPPFSDPMLNNSLSGILTNLSPCLHLTNAISNEHEDIRPFILEHQSMAEENLFNLSQETRISNDPPPPLPKITEKFINEMPLQNDPGNYNFQIHILKSEGNKKPTYEYSEMFRKLYTKDSHPVPLRLSVQSPLPQGCHVNIFFVYNDVIVRKENIKCCANHIETAKKEALQFYESFVRVENTQNVTYFRLQDQASGRFGVRIQLPESTTRLDYALRFMCRNGCIGIDRRPTTLVTLLTDRDGTIIGINCCNVKVCATPSRDIKKDESKPTTSQANAGIPMHPEADDLLHSDTDPGDEHIYELIVRGRENFMILNAIKEGLQLRSKQKKMMAVRKRY